MYSVGGCHEIVTGRGATCVPDPVEVPGEPPAGEPEEVGVVESFVLVDGSEPDVVVEPVVVAPDPPFAVGSAVELEEVVGEALAEPVEPVVPVVPVEPVVPVVLVVLVPVLVLVLVPVAPGVPPPTLAVSAVLGGSDVPCAVCESEDVPPPHAVSTLPKINDPATASVHERTPVLFIGTPRPKTPFQIATRSTQLLRVERNGIHAGGRLPKRTAAEGPSP